MKFLILSLIIAVSTTLITGVAFVLSIFYIKLWDSLSVWEQDSSQWILQTQKQILANSLTSLKILEEYSFDQVQLHMVVINNLIYKYYNQQLTANKNTIFTICSYRELIFNQCQQNVYTQLNQSQYYVDLYFVRTLFKYDLLMDNQKQFIQMNDFVSFYGKAAFYASQLEGLIQLAFIYNSDVTSVQYGIPSGFYNYTDSDYENCLGNDFIEPYDPRCRPWFQFSSKHPGYFFFQPYLDSLGQDLLMTLSTQIVYNNQLQSVNSIDIYMINLNKLFNSTQGNNSYKVLLHEFNFTVFSHPKLYNTNLTSWPELEYQNITTICNNTQQEKELCLEQKQQFYNQVNSTINFIQTGNYSIDQKFNLDPLYQYWTIYGDQRISMIYPIRSQIKGFNNQQPYSFAIVLAAQVIQDKREQLKLFNLLNANYIRVPLIISFIFISILVIIFIINYGRFQVLQIWYPIELLTLFLRQSLLMDQSCRIQKSEINNERQKIQQSINKRSPNIKYENLNNTSIFKKIDQNESQQKMLDQTNSFIFGNLNNFKVNNSIIFIKDKKHEEFKSNHQINKNKQSISIQPEEIFNLDAVSSQKTVHSVRSFQFQFNRNKSILQSNIFSQIQDFHNCQKAQDGQNKILKGLKPAFLEMQIIKKTFQELELVINYSVQSSQLKSQDNLRTLFHFTKAKQLFLKLKNDTGLSRCYYNLGLIYLLKEEYSISSEYFESAIQLNLDWLGLSSFCQINQYYASHKDQEEKNQLIILTKRIFSLAYSQKCAAFQQISVESKSNKQDSLDNFIDNLHSFSRFTKKESRAGLKSQYSQQLLTQSLILFQKVEKIIQYFIQDFTEIFQIFLFQEIVEILIQLDLKFQIQNYISKIDFLFFNNQITYQVQKAVKKNISLKENFSIKQMVIETFKGRQLFLLGMIEKANKNLFEAIEYLTQSLEIPTHYNYFQKVRTFQALASVFEQVPFEKSFIDEEYLSSETEASVDLVVLIQFDKNLSQFLFINIIENFKKFNFFGRNDRIQILLFNKEIHQLIPYTQIQSDHHWKIIIDSLHNIGKDLIKNEQKQKKQPTLEQIIFQSLIYIYENNNLEQQQIFKSDFNNLNYKNQSRFFETYYQQNRCKKRKKVLLLLSNRDVYFKLSNKFLNKLQPFQKIKIYHLKENNLFQIEEKQYENDLFSYELLLSQNELILNLSRQRFYEYFDIQSVFLTILNHF
ncbi:tetratricopeptide repeat protein (macronuclear) [Tetrahymena thermophila SB210]|uniref:Tetratricopeptide repeat protein n=1 Tax=Tetrahymena thermophila (strain SB210) TaxID=312017 RepID=W7XL88_TETTS|nr:tetratricopeptide repeat protein [Tetrahymena thermophila SB210]EWS75864.1 tetratricopeptide repeat protein [Tetrahymena thermophila SB210]|eukprot:XP_012651599.1 tetratricopeptide repeat protein [Tetrahymena thermophila SB210]